MLKLIESKLAAGKRPSYEDLNNSKTRHRCTGNLIGQNIDVELYYTNSADCGGPNKRLQSLYFKHCIIIII